MGECKKLNGTDPASQERGRSGSHQRAQQLRVGLSVGVLILTILVLLVFFILLTIGAWNNESSFNALVQGTLISGAGKAVTALRQKSKAEDGESLAGLVDEILDGQKDAAAEAE